jgi:hypothetical protein
MFQFPRFASTGLWIRPATSGHYSAQVPPFGHPRIAACLRLPEAFRSLPRPSSLPGAKASTVRPSTLDHFRRGEHRLATLENLRIRLSQNSRVMLASSNRLVPLVEMTGFEPATPCLQSRCSPS